MLLASTTENRSDANRSPVRRVVNGSLYDQRVRRRVRTEAGSAAEAGGPVPPRSWRPRRPSAAAAAAAGSSAWVQWRWRWRGAVAGRRWEAGAPTAAQHVSAASARSAPAPSAGAAHGSGHGSASQPSPPTHSAAAPADARHDHSLASSQLTHPARTGQLLHTSSPHERQVVTRAHSN